ncbi:hypothetical protein ACO0K9_11865 [Undibacterium sp. Ji50W]|uniref:hypothetical protein n=1 Tax=Undibacterium sp. Ji50W TaxID=3413041 RepID=UPI003BF26234
MFQTITINLPIDMPASDWEKVSKVYREMDGWIENSEWPCWYGKEGSDRYISASAEPSGLLFDGEMEPGLWTAWFTVLCARLTLALGRPVHDAEM